ncbi:MAG: hypothetical protein NZ873_00740 [Crenarchaeota archaeon]|nr:hypothetical protein [Thermoproteota archaeon]MDW8033696.1 hypothetical protein [Nitrososphaerota archaeon]
MLRKLGFVYIQEEDTLILHSLEPGEIIVSLPKTVIRIFIEKTGEGFKISIEALGEEKLLKMLVLKETGPAALRLTDDIADRISRLRLSWDLRDLKIECLKLDRRKLVLDFITVPIRDS